MTSRPSTTVTGPWAALMTRRAVQVLRLEVVDLGLDEAQRVLTGGHSLMPASP